MKKGKGRDEEGNHKYTFSLFFSFSVLFGLDFLDFSVFFLAAH